MNSDTTANPTATGDVTAARRLLSIIVPVTLATALADFLFYGALPGLSVGILFMGLGVLLLACRRGKARGQTWLLLSLLTACSVQCGIELSFSNVVAASVLTLALAGDVFQPHLTGLWARLSEAIYGFVTAFWRWAGVGILSKRSFEIARAGRDNWASNTLFAVKAVLPAILLLGVFTIIFVTGNAVFSAMMERANQAAIDFWLQLDVTPLRLIWWAVLATAALGLFHRTPAPAEPRWWTLVIPRFARRESRLGFWQTATVLVALNVLFCVVNTLEVIFLWRDSALPPGVSYSAFVHSGVNSLIGAVILSAVVIAGLFQQDDTIAGNRWLKRLAYVWVAQNFVLIAGVLRRLLSYTETYHLTEKRVYVACFLLLVTIGFLLLGRFVQVRRSFNWLLGRNAIATFALFFALQFLNVAGWVARWNVDRWERSGELDVEYLASLGPSAWPSLKLVAESPGKGWTAERARAFLIEQVNEPRSTDWRGYQWRIANARAQVSRLAVQ